MPGGTRDRSAFAPRKEDQIVGFSEQGNTVPEIEGMAGETARRKGLPDFIYLGRREREFRPRGHAGEHLLQKRIRFRGQKHDGPLACKRK